MLADTAANRLYLQLAETALEDSIVTDDEATILRILATTLGVQPSDTALCLSIVRGEEMNPFDGSEDFLLIEILCPSREGLEALQMTISCIEFDRIDLAYQKQIGRPSNKI